MAYFLIKRGEWFYYFRRVPTHFKKYDSRPHVRISLKTKDPLEAQRRAFLQNDSMEKYWNDLVKHGGMHTSNEKWKDSIVLLRSHGFPYKGINEIADNASNEEILERLNVIKNKGLDTRLIKALTGTANNHHLLIGNVLDTYFELTQDKIAGKSDHWIRKWKNPRKLAIKNFIQAVENKLLSEVSRKDINTFHLWWMNRIKEQGKNASSAKKDMILLKDILRITSTHNEIDLDINALFSSVKFKNIRSSRVPFEAAFVQEEILKQGKLDALNEEARALIYLMADTGARVNEIIGLLPEDIFLNEKIPFIWIRPNKKRDLKNRPSERKIPLVGSALIGISLVKSGFSRYQNTDAVSNLVNQFMDDNGLKPSSNHALYSLRHTFKDRLRDIGAPEEVTDELMGHAGHRPHYGRGHTLETKYEWLNKIAFKV